MTDAVLLLMHQGASFTAEVAAAARARGLALVALSSRPARPETFERSREHLADWLLTDGANLAHPDIEGIAARFAARGYRVRAAIATFEGYRLLMAELNAALGARDCACDALRACLNKYELRQTLLARGLSAVRCRRLAPGRKPELERDARWFVKPVRGAASFAAFVLEDGDELADLPALQRQMRDDAKMAAIFMDQFDFLAEEYVEGPECSFETIAAGEAVHLCVHEKARVERCERTTLELMSVSPPVSLATDVVLEGARFVSACLAALNLDAGAFHVEAKYWTAKRRWEIIEINPRMGGSLINASVETVTGTSLLDPWLATLLAPEPELERLRAHLLAVSQVEALRAGRVPKASLFLSKYGQKGRTIDTIAFAPGERDPRVLAMHAHGGTELERSDRALCLMDALWEVDCADLAREVGALERLADERFRVAYREPSGVAS